MASMGEICNDVAAAIYRVEAAVWIGLTNSACASNVNPMSGCQIEKLFNQKNKRFRFQLKKFYPEREKKRLVASPKTRFDPLKICDSKPLSINDSAEAINKISPQSILHTPVLKRKVDFVRSLIFTTIVQPKQGL